MSLMLRTWVCDLCDAEHKRGLIPPQEPLDDPDYKPLAKGEETGDAKWANQQLQKGRVIEITTCPCAGRQPCRGYRYRFYRKNEEVMVPGGQWCQSIGIKPGSGYQTFIGPQWDGHVFKIITDKG